VTATLQVSGQFTQQWSNAQREIIREFFGDELASNCTLWVIDLDDGFRIEAEPGSFGAKHMLFSEAVNYIQMGLVRKGFLHVDVQAYIPPEVPGFHAHRVKHLLIKSL